MKDARLLPLRSPSPRHERSVGQPERRRLPGQLEDYVSKEVKLTPAQRAQLFAGKPVTRMLESEPSHEVSIFGAIWVNAPTARYVQLAQNVEEFEKGDNFRITKRISSPPRADDFTRLDLPDEDVVDLRTCRVGGCELKLSEAALTRVRKEIDWSKPTAEADAEALARRLALEYVNGYLEGGDARWRSTATRSVQRSSPANSSRWSIACRRSRSSCRISSNTCLGFPRQLSRTASRFSIGRKPSSD